MAGEFSLEEALAAGETDILEINSDLRTIIVPSGYIFGVFNDKDVLPVLFKMNKTYDTLDMSTFQIRINFQNAAGTTSSYIVTDKKVDDNTIYFSWLLGREVFVGEGTVKFVVCLRKFNTDGTVDKEFNTTIARSTVLNGLEADDPESDPYKIIGQIDSIEILLQCQEIQADINTKAESAEDLYEKIKLAEINYGAPFTAATASEMVNRSRVYVYTGSESGYNNGHWYYYNGTAWTDGGTYQSTGVNTDKTLTVPDMAADAKAVGDEVSELKSDLEQLEPGLTEKAKQALLTCFQNVAWINDQGQTYYDNLYDALYPETGLVRIEAVFNQGSAVITDRDSLDTLKAYLTVTGYYSDGTTRQETDYVLSGTLAIGTSTITVSIGTVTTTFTVVVSEYWDYSWNYVDGLPENNGMTLTNGNQGNTFTLTNDGLNVSVVDTSNNTVRYQYNLNADRYVLYSAGVFELEFEINSYGQYLTTPYGFGVRFAAGFGYNPNITPKSRAALNVVFSGNGRKFRNATPAWEIFGDPLSVNTTYVARIEQSISGATLYLNGTAIRTFTASEYSEIINSPQVTITQGVTATIKRFSLRMTE